VGVSSYPQAAELDADQLLRQADQAMYQAKVAGKNRYHVFDTQRDSDIRGHFESLERVRLALGQREFVLHYQPKVNMRQGALTGVEALIRWQHPERGLMPPMAFLPAIEDHQLSIDVGEWVIEAALQQHQRWCAMGLDIPVSVNVGALQLQQPDFVLRLQDILRRHPQVQPSKLQFEILETSAVQDMQQVTATIAACKLLGIDFALDDFGTGYSSLTYLRQLPVALLKIDQSFVRGMLENPEDQAILRGVVGLAAAFGRDVIAEGVETEAHGTLLLQLGCEAAQGFGIARPMPGDAIAGWLQSWQPRPEWLAQTSHSSHWSIPHASIHPFHFQP
jgi:EAL domain-containing protein (putative c-di-GMP-specific phosphodiesterase class I)